LLPLGTIVGALLFDSGAAKIAVEDRGSFELASSASQIVVILIDGHGDRDNFLGSVSV